MGYQFKVNWLPVESVPKRPWFVPVLTLSLAPGQADVSPPVTASCLLLFSSICIVLLYISVVLVDSLPGSAVGGNSSRLLTAGPLLPVT